MLGTFYSKLLVMTAVVIFFTDIPNYFHTIGTNLEESAPIRWIIGFGLLSLPLLLTQGLRSDILKSPLTTWCFGYAWIAMAGFLLSSQSDIAWQEVRWRFLAIGELIMFMALFAKVELARLARQALVAAVLFGVAVNIYEFFVPLSFSRVLGRSAGFYIDPNITGEALVLGMVFSVTVVPSWFRGPFILLAGIGVLLTISRGAMLAWVIAVVGLMLVGRVNWKNFLLPVSLSLLLAAVFLVPRLDQLLTSLASSGVINKNMEERLDWFMDPTGVEDYSGWERAYLAKQAWDRIVEHPFLGSGTGSTREAVVGSHNQYLEFMQDHGLLGAAILPLLILAVTWRAQGETRGVAIAFGCTAIVLSFFSHTVLNQPHTLMMFALMAAMGFTSRESEMIKTQAMITAEVT